MDNNVPLSVVLCTYNNETFIRKAVDSILNQTYKNFELIIINDGSTDHTQDILSSYNDPRIVIINKENTGLPDSLNLGVKKAKYDWIARMDGDDIAVIDRFEKQIRYISENVAVIGGSVNFINTNGDFIAKGTESTSSLIIKIKLMLGISPIVHPTALINKKYLLNCKGYDNCLFGAEDYDLWLRIAKVGKVINMPCTLLNYRVNPNGVSLSNKDRQRKQRIISLIKYHLGINSIMNERTYEVINEELVKHDIGIKGNITSSRIARFFNTGCSIIKEQIAIHTIVNKLKKDRSNEIIAN